MAASPPRQLQGTLYEYHNQRNLTVFVSGTAPDVVLYVGGLTDGFLSRPYLVPLFESITPKWSLAQAQLSSSLFGYGFSSLKKDAEELDFLIDFLKSHVKVRHIVLLGASTGCQDSVFYLKHGKHANQITAIILQAPVSDRESFMEDAPQKTTESLKIAEKMIAEGRANDLMPTDTLTVPVTAYRFHSLAGKLGDDDLFSSDFTDEEFKERIGHVHVPTLIAYSMHDQYVPKHVDKHKVTEQLRKTMGTKAEVALLEDDDHAVNRHVDVFVKRVAAFLKKLEG